MWSFEGSIDTEDQHGDVQQTDFSFEDRTASALTTIKMDATAIKDRLECQLSREKRQHSQTVDTNTKSLKAMTARINRLENNINQINAYLGRLELFLVTEELISECERLNIDPAHRIVFGGGTLKKATTELEQFRKEPVFFQAFDRGYDQG